MDDGPPSLWFSKRLLVVILIFVSFINFQILRNNINITVIEMTSNKTIAEGNKTIIKPADFDWDSMTIGLTLSVMGFGSLLSFLGAIIVDWLGPATSAAGCMLLASVLTLLHPIALNFDFKVFLACRFFIGMFESFFYPSCASIAVKWFPENERSKLVSFSFNGGNVGVALTYPLCGYLAHKLGWEAVFYVTGAISVFTSLLCMIIIRNRPLDDSCISRIELDYILQGTDKDDDTNEVIKNRIHIRRFLHRCQFWSICICVFSYMWLSTFTGSFLPLYIYDMTHSDVKEIGLLSGIPNIIFILSVPFSEFYMNYWNKKSGDTMTMTRIYKIMMAFACISSSASFIILILIPSFNVALIVISCIQIETSFMVTIIQIVPVNLCPGSSNIVYSMLAFFASLGTIISQIVTSSILNYHVVGEWNISFILTSVILLISAIIFVIFGSNERQPWSLPKNKRKLSSLCERRLPGFMLYLYLHGFVNNNFSVMSKSSPLED